MHKALVKAASPKCLQQSIAASQRGLHTKQALHYVTTTTYSGAISISCVCVCVFDRVKS